MHAVKLGSQTSVKILICLAWGFKQISTYKSERIHTR
jgi:hypothetical protein